MTANLKVRATTDSSADLPVRRAYDAVYDLVAAGLIIAVLPVALRTARWLIALPHARPTDDGLHLARS